MRYTRRNKKGYITNNFSELEEARRR